MEKAATNQVAMYLHDEKPALGVQQGNASPKIAKLTAVAVAGPEPFAGKIEAAVASAQEPAASLGSTASSDQSRSR